MANTPNMIGPDLTIDQQQLARRQALADMLRQQSLAQEQPQMAGGMVVPYHPLQGLAKLGQAYFANKMQEDIGQQQKQLMNERQQKIAEILKTYGKTTTQEPSVETDPYSGKPLYSYAEKQVDASPSQQMMQDWQLSQLDPSFSKVIEARRTMEDQQKARLEQIALQRELMKQQQLDNNKPFYQFFQTGSGFAVGNARTGQMSMASTPEVGTPIIPGKFDVPLQRKLSEASSVGHETGKGLGESQVTLEDMQSMMPHLYELTNQLSELGKKATYTAGGQLMDAARRQAGLPVGEGAIARKEYITKVDNEILPLLRQTFGAQFTQKEGESLRATLGDPNASPAEKDAVLRSFIETKADRIKSLQRRTGSPVTLPKGGAKFLGFE